MSVIIFLSLSSLINYNKNDVCKGDKRITHYVSGLTRFYQLIKDRNVLLFDNTTDTGLPTEIETILPVSTDVKYAIVNDWGPINKGAGVLEQWIYCSDIIKNYDWIIHFEPRQLLKNADFFTSFFSHKRPLFKKMDKQVWTGLFAIETHRLLQFCQKISPKYLAEKRICLENALYDFLQGDFDTVEDLGLIWHDTWANLERHV